MKYVWGWVGCYWLTAMFVGITFNALDWNINIGFVLALLLATGVFVLILKLLKYSKEKNYKLTCENMDYNFREETLKLDKRSAFNKKVIKAKPIKDYNLNYHEAQYVYTSASVGGITTGGVTKIGDYNSIDVSSTGKFEIKCYCYSLNEYRKVKKIKLTKELTVCAENNPFIKQFLRKENTLVLEKKTKRDVSEQVSMLIKSGRTDMATRYMKQNYFETQLTREECIKVIDWISGVDIDNKSQIRKGKHGACKSAKLESKAKLKEKFKFVAKQYCIFENEGIVCKQTKGKCYIPYESITKIYVDTDMLVIKTNSDNIKFRTILLWYSDSIDKQELKKCSEFAETRKLELDSANNKSTPSTVRKM